MQTDSTWKITTPFAVSADEATVQQLLGRLRGLSVRQFAADVATDLDKYGLAAPMATVTLRSQGAIRWHSYWSVRWMHRTLSDS